MLVEQDGFNIGIRKTLENNSDYVWIMDDDTIPKNDTLEKMIDIVKLLNEKKEKFSFLASSVFGTNGDAMNVPALDYSKTENGYPDWYKMLNYGIVKIKIATFVSLLIDKDAVKKCGLPCKDFFIWGDDTEYTIRLVNNYGNGYLVGSSIAIHKRKLSRDLTIKEEDDINRINMFYYKYRNELITTREYFGLKATNAMIKNNLKEVIKTIFCFNCKYKLKKALIILSGTFDFIFKRYDYKAFKNRFEIIN